MDYSINGIVGISYLGTNEINVSSLLMPWAKIKFIWIKVSKIEKKTWNHRQYKWIFKCLGMKKGLAKHTINERNHKEKNT